MNYLLLLTLLFLSACSNAPKIVTGKGAVYGTLSADSHPSFRNKTANKKSSSLYSDSTTGRIRYKKNMVNYPKLKELYVGLVSANYKPQRHHLWIKPSGISPYSLALAPNDRLHIHNNTETSQNLFITGINDEQGFQSFPELKAGKNATFTLKLEGHLELLSEEDDTLKMQLFSKKNMKTKKIASGQTYQFELLSPNNYQLIFWYWRLGSIQQNIQIHAQKNLRIDKSLSVDSVLNAN